METIDQGGLFAALGVFLFIYCGIFLLIIVSMWKIFSKAGRPGWAAIVPIYNLIVWLDVCGKPTWWIILMFIPIVNIVIIIMLYNQLSASFGQGIGTTLLLLFLPFIGFPMLAFGSAQYTGTIPASRPI